MSQKFDGLKKISDERRDCPSTTQQLPEPRQTLIDMVMYRALLERPKATAAVLWLFFVQAHALAAEVSITGWQSLKFGMTRAEVGRVYETKEDNFHCVNEDFRNSVAPYDCNTLEVTEKVGEFKVTLYFRPNFGLAKIELVASSSYDDLKSAIVQRYGSGLEEVTNQEDKCDQTRQNFDRGRKIINGDFLFKVGRRYRVASATASVTVEELAIRLCDNVPNEVRARNENWYERMARFFSRSVTTVSYVANTVNPSAL